MNNKFIIYKVIKLLNGKVVENEVKAFGMFENSYNNIGHAKAIARIALNDLEPNGVIKDVLVKNNNGEIIFRANQFVNGIYGK